MARLTRILWGSPIAALLAITAGALLLGAPAASAGSVAGAGTSAASTGTYNVTVYFHETGLAAGTHWHVSILSVGPHPIAFVGSSKKSVLTVVVYSSTDYHYKIRATGYTSSQISPSKGQLKIRTAGPYRVSVTFT